MIGPAGDLLGIGSLQLEGVNKGKPELVNMVVPIDLLKPIYDDLLTLGRANRPPRPWLGVYCIEVEDRIVIAGLAKGGPAQRAGLQTGDLVLAIAGTEVNELPRASAKSGRSAMPAWKCRCKSGERAIRLKCGSIPATATAI